MRSAFGFGGQKCSANTRVYVERPVHDELVRLLVEKTEKITIGDPLPRENWLGPVIDQRGRRPPSGRRWPRPAATARSTPAASTSPTATWLAASTSSPPSWASCPPTIGSSGRAVRAVHRHAAVDSLDEALALANDSVYGLTAGVYSEDQAEVASGSSTRSRRASCTSTAGPVRRPGPGRACRPSAAGRAPARPARPACSMYYVAQFLREQSHTIVD